MQGNTNIKKVILVLEIQDAPKILGKNLGVSFQNGNKERRSY